ncbi:hypothetical protein ACJMK2_023610 [Sinanodonta woodiana]|uniref:YqaJ viral recombinase domain-containing protein n=1 Tax=Sinanodonta woodiana TaxID=1069815 RepID=A0ABD3T5M2_SINWO
MTIVEVKCPYASKDKVNNHNTVPYLKLSPSVLTLDTNHDNYYQIQGQMMCTGRMECKLVVFTMKEIKVVLIKFDKDFVDKMVTNLKEYFDGQCKEALINTHFYKIYYSYGF